MHELIFEALPVITSGSQSFTCHPAFTSQWQNITALRLVLRASTRLSWPGWLVIGFRQASQTRYLPLIGWSGGIVSDNVGVQRTRALRDRSLSEGRLVTMDSSDPSPLATRSLLTIKPVTHWQGVAQLDSSVTENWQSYMLCTATFRFKRLIPMTHERTTAT